MALNEDITIYCPALLFGVQVKLWPGVHCLQCLSFNGNFDVMNEAGPPSVGQKELALISLHNQTSAAPPIRARPETPISAEGKRVLFSLCFLMNFPLFIWLKYTHASWRKSRGERALQNDLLKPTRCPKKMAEFPPRHPGFGSSGKCFLIENLLRPGNSSPVGWVASGVHQKRCSAAMVCGPLGLVLKGKGVYQNGASENHTCPQVTDGKTVQPLSGKITCNTFILQCV